MKDSVTLKGLFFRAFSINLSFLLLALPSYAFAKPQVAVLPWKINSTENLDFVKDAMTDMLYTRLGALGEAELVRPDLVKAAASAHKSGEVNEAFALEAGKRLNADFVLFGSLTVFGAAISLDAKLVNVKDGTVKPFFAKAGGMDAVIGMTERLSADVSAHLAPPKPLVAAKETAPAPTAITAPVVVPAPTAPVVAIKSAPAPDDEFIVRPKEGAIKSALWKSALMEGNFIAMAAADLNKEGVKKFFLLKGTGLVIAKINGARLETVKELETGTSLQNIAITACDCFGSGSTAIYVSAVKDFSPYGYVVEYKDNDYRITVTGAPWFMRAVNTDRGVRLIGQGGYRKPDGFYGPLRLLKRQGTELVDAGEFDVTLPKSADIYRFELMYSAGVKDPSVVMLDRRNYLRLFKREKDKWEETLKTNDYFGGTLNYIEPGEGSSDAGPVPVEGRFYIVDLKGDGNTSLLVKRNVPGGLGRWATTARSFTASYVLNLSMNETEGTFLNELWRTKEIENYMSDFFIDDAGEGGKRLYMLIVEGAGVFSGRLKSYILSFKMSV